MDDREYIIILYDYYSDLFNEVQRDCFEEYYFDNLSLSEIAINMNKSRNAIHKCIKTICNKLLEYEKCLKLYEKNIKINKLLDQIDNNKLKKMIRELI